MNTGPDGVAFTRYDRNQPADLLDDICCLYDRVFSQPSFRRTDDESGHHRQSLARLMVNITFGLVTAEAVGELIGFVYGVALPSDTKW